MKNNLSSIENQYRSFVKNFIGIAFQRRMDFIPVFCHGQVRKITGYFEKDFLKGKPRWDQIIHPEDLPKIYAENDKLKHIPDTTLDREYRIIRKDGQVRWVREIIQNLTNGDRKLSLVQGVIYDITKRRRSEAERQGLAQDLARERDILEAIMENTRTHLAYFDTKFNIIQANSIFIKDSPCSKNELIGQNLFKMFPYSNKFRVLFRKVVKTGQAEGFERTPFAFFHQPDKKTTYWDWTLVPLKDKKGRVSGLVLSLVNVTADVRSDQERESLLTQIEQEKQRAEQLRIEAEKRAAELDAVFMALTDVLIVFNNQGEAVSANPAALYELGFNPVGQNYRKIVQKVVMRRPDGQPIPEKELGLLLKKPLAKETLPSQTFLLTNSKAEEVAVLLSASLIRHEGKNAGIVVVGHDVSERLKLEKQKDAFVAMASHELKTPLTTLQAFTQILQKRFAGQKDVAARRYLDKIDTQLTKLGDLIRELLEVSRTQTGPMELHLERFDLNKLISEVIEDMQQSTDQHSLIKRGVTHHPVWADRDRISQVLFNFLTNAIKYSPGVGQIIIRVKDHPGEVEVSVRDFGVGISLENQQKIFDRFFRIPGISQERLPGLGLGLYISSEIIKRHSGKIWVKSQPGKGSTFYFTIPLKERNT